MAIPVLIIGESGTGKSTSLRNLKAQETFIIAVIDKPLPFRNSYARVKNENEKLTKNISVTDDYQAIVDRINHVSKNMPHIKNLIIDDFQYVMANEFMAKALEKGYDKFTQMAVHVNSILTAIRNGRHDLQVYILSHSEEKDGRYKVKTIGKMLDEKITIEGLFTVVLHTKVIENKYCFITQNDGVHIAKSPLDMFEHSKIPNDLQYVKEKIDQFYNADIPDSQPLNESEVANVANAVSN